MEKRYSPHSTESNVSTIPHVESSRAERIEGYETLYFQARDAFLVSRGFFERGLSIRTIWCVKYARNRNVSHYDGNSLQYALHLGQR